MNRCAFWKYHLDHSAEKVLDVGKLAAETTRESPVERETRHTESPKSQGAVGMGEVDGVTRDGIVMARLDVQVKGAGVSKISSGLWLGITGEGIRGHELIQERNM